MSAATMLVFLNWREKKSSPAVNGFLKRQMSINFSSYILVSTLHREELGLPKTMQ